MTTATPLSSSAPLAFVGGGNMASAILGGLLKQGLPPSAVEVVEPFAPARERLQQDFGITALAAPGPVLSRAALVVWAVKPQTFKDAGAECRPYLGDALHLSVAAGIRSDSIAQWLGTQRVVRAMPNTPALVGRGMTGLYARPAVAASDRAWVERVIATTGESLWVDSEADLDAVTALSGSGPAYVFLFIEAMIRAGTEMGLPPEQAKRLAVGTFAGAAQLAGDASEPPQALRERVTSKGGTTYAAISSMQAAGLPQAFVEAMHAACRRARELGDEFGRS